MILNIIVYILGLLGLVTWSLILLFLLQKKHKKTYEIMKIVTVSTIIFKLIFGWIASAIIHLADPKTETVKLIVILTFYSTSQRANTVTFFNFYSFAFEYRTPKIDPNLPHWITCIFGVLIPFFVSVLTHFLDQSVTFSYEPDLVEHVIGVKDER